MAFWSSRIEPKRVNRWYMVFGGGGNLDSLTFALKSVEKPKYKQTPVLHKFANHNFKYPGRVTWDAIPIKFASVTQPHATDLVNRIKALAGYKNPNEVFDPSGINYSFLSKEKFNDAIAGNGVQLKQVDVDGKTIELWTINNPFFTDVKFGSLDYGNDGIIDVECTMRYDWAELTKLGNGSTDGVDIASSTLIQKR